MFALDARFTLLAVFCCLSTQWLSPSGIADAAVISRSYETTDTSFQHVFPWSKAKRGVSKYQDKSGSWLNPENGRIHKVRLEDVSPTNPFQRVAHVLLSHLKGRGHRRSSHKTIIIPNNHGSQYLLSHARRAAGTPQWMSTPSNTTSPNPHSNATTVQSTAVEGMPGTVIIQSNAVTIASLVLQHLNGDYILNASDKDQTTMYLVNAPTSTTTEAVPSSANDDVPVYVTIPAPEGSGTWCASYDPNPKTPQPMKMVPCLNPTAAEVSTSQNSQTFMFNSTSGQIRPTWFSNDNDSNARAASLPNDSTAGSQNATGTTTSAQSTPTTVNSRDVPAPNAQNVTLIFVPASKKVAAAEISETPGNPSSSAMTTTMTQTVTVFASGSSSSTSTTGAGTPSASGLNVEVIGGDSMVSSAAPSSSSSAAAANMASSSVVSSSATSSSAIAMDVASSSVASSSVYPAASSSAEVMNAASSSVASSSAYPSSSIDAAAVASSIVASYSSSMASASASASKSSDLASAAGISISASSTSTSGTPSGTFVAAVMERFRAASSQKMMIVDTDPYKWQFKADSR